MTYSLRDFKEELKNGSVGTLYIFHGEEGYLREHYLSQLQRNTVGDCLPEFNVTVINRAPELRELIDAVESYPAMCEKKLVIVRDFDIFSVNAEFAKGAEELFSDMPPHCVLVFVYGNIEYKPDKRKKLYKTVEQNARIVRFDRAARTDLISWIKRRFLALDKDIDAETADYLLFYCGEIMQNLIPEIEKISAYAKKKSVTRADVEVVASRHITSAVFDASNAIADRKYAKALAILADLENGNESAIPVLALIVQQFKRLYAAKLILSRGGGEREVMALFDMRSSYPAKCAISAARGMSRSAIRRAITLCAEADEKLKFGAGWEELSFLVSQLSEERA